MLKIYKPWHGNFVDTLKCKNIITEYNKLLNSPECPKTLKYNSDQALEAFSDSKQRHQPTSENTFPEIDLTSPDIYNRAKKAYDGFGTLFSAMGSDFSMVNLDFGINFDWSKPKCELPHNMTKTKASEWLMNATEFQLQEFDNN